MLEKPCDAQAAETRLFFTVGIRGFHTLRWASLVAQMAENLPSEQETWVRSLGGEDEMPAHIS